MAPVAPTEYIRRPGRRTVIRQIISPIPIRTTRPPSTRQLMAPFSGKCYKNLVTTTIFLTIFIVSGLKEKASLAKSASIRSYDSARGRLSNNSTASNTAKAKPPPPPPRRTSSNQAPGDPSRAADVENINWENLSDEDKQAFFTWLDEFFARYLGLPLPATAPTSVETSSDTPAPSLRPSPSLPPRRVSFRANESTGPETPAEAAPEPGRRKLPPMLSQKGPVSPPAGVGC